MSTRRRRFDLLAWLMLFALARPGAAQQGAAAGSNPVQFFPNPVVGGQTAIGVVTLAAPGAAGGGTRLSLTSSNPAAVAVPAALTLPPGLSTVTFPVATLATMAPGPVTISVGGPFGTAAAVLLVQPGIPGPPPPGPPVGMTITPNPIVGGQTASGQVLLSQPAGAGGVVVSLTSSNPAAAVAPAVVTVPAGTITVAFPITTFPVAATTPVTISAVSAYGAASATLLVSPAGSPPPASGAVSPPAYDPANGHWYQEFRLASKLTWPEARAAAEQLSYAGLPGHLATITSPAENQFVSDTLTRLGPLGDIWIGGYQDHQAPDYREPAGGWRWVTGEPWSYTSWSGGEPNNVNGGEDALETNSGGTWNDLPTYSGVAAYLVEYEPPAPRPPTLAQLLLFPNPVPGGLLALGQVTLAQPAGPAGLTVALTSSLPAVALAPAAITVPPGATTATFPLLTFPVAAATPVAITATTAQGAATATLQVLPLTPPASPPPPLATPAAARLLVSCDTGNSVLRFDGPTGAFLDPLVRPGSGGLAGPHGLALGPDGSLYVASRSGGGVLRYVGQTGAFRGTFVPPGSGGLRVPIALAFGPDGNLYVTSNGSDAVLRYDGRTGAFLGAFVAPAAGGLSQPYALLFGPDGTLYVSSEGRNSVYEFDGRTGAFLGQIVPPGSGGLQGPNGLAFGPDGNLYVSSWQTHSILRYDGHERSGGGAFLGVFVPPHAGGLTEPWDLTFGPDGNLYVASAGSNQVLRYDGRTGAFLGPFTTGSGLARPVWLLFVPPGD